MDMISIQVLIRNSTMPRFKRLMNLVLRVNTHFTVTVSIFQAGFISLTQSDTYNCLIFLFSIFPGCLPTELISACGNYCLYPLNNNLDESHPQFKRDPDATTAKFEDKERNWWLYDDFARVLPIKEESFPDGLFVEYAISRFFSNGCTSKLAIILL